jgi:hypothetical protein
VSNEILFQIEQDEEMLAAICRDPEMATQGASLEELITMIRELDSMPLRRGRRAARLAETAPFPPRSSPFNQGGLKLPRDLSGNEVCRALRRLGLT